MLIHFSFVFDRWTMTPMPPSEPTDGTVAMGCTVPGFWPCSGACYTISVTRGLPRTIVARTVSLDVDAARSTWTFRLTPPTRAWWPGSPQLGAMTLMTLWRGLPTRPSCSLVSATCRASMTLPSPYSLFRTRATWCGVSVWPSLVTPSFRPTTRVGCSWHAMPSPCAPYFRRSPWLAITSASAWRITPTRWRTRSDSSRTFRRATGSSFRRTSALRHVSKRWTMS
jgi:hypothetical protein